MNSGIDETTRERIEALTHEHIDIVPYDAQWATLYAEEERFLQSVLPPDLVTRIAHIGSTAVPGLSAKPIIDVQVEVTSLARARAEAVPLLHARGYEFIWRPSIGEQAPFYAWFIKRDASGERTHHIHMVEPDTASIDRLRFRDAMRSDASRCQAYEALKRELAARYPEDRAAYTRAKTSFIQRVLREHIP